MRKAGLLLNPQTITSHRTGVGSTANNSKAAQELRNKIVTTNGARVPEHAHTCGRRHMPSRKNEMTEQYNVTPDQFAGSLY